jgi:hypothetical protein
VSAEMSGLEDRLQRANRQLEKGTLKAGNSIKQKQIGGRWYRITVKLCRKQWADTMKQASRRTVSPYHSALSILHERL